MTSVGAVMSRGTSALGKVGKAILKSTPQAIMPLVFCGPAVYTAFNLKRDLNANKVEGLNTECGTREIINETGGWVAFGGVQGLLGFLMAVAPLPVKPAIFAAQWIAAGKVMEWWKKVRPSQAELVEQACKDKGIDYNS